MWIKAAACSCEKLKCTFCKCYRSVNLFYFFYEFAQIILINGANNFTFFPLAPGCPSTLAIRPLGCTACCFWRWVDAVSPFIHHCSYSCRHNFSGENGCPSRTTPHTWQNSLPMHPKPSQNTFPDHPFITNWFPETGGEVLLWECDAQVILAWISDVSENTCTSIGIPVLFKHASSNTIKFFTPTQATRCWQFAALKLDRLNVFGSWVLINVLQVSLSPKNSWQNQRGGLSQKRNTFQNLFLCF